MVGQCRRDMIRIPSIGDHTRTLLRIGTTGLMVGWFWDKEGKRGGAVVVRYRIVDNVLLIRARRPYHRLRV